MTFIAALRIDARCVLGRPVNRVRFLAYVSQFLAPTLRPGDIVVADNLGWYKWLSGNTLSRSNPCDSIVTLRFAGEPPDVDE